MIATSHKIYWEKVSYDCFGDGYLSIIADGTSISTFLCTQKVQVTAVYKYTDLYKTELNDDLLVSDTQ